jgi:hypothetical protein
MPDWRERWQFIDGSAQRLGGWAGAIGAIVAAFGAAVYAMTGVTNSISALAAYGWGVPVLVAIGIVLVIVVGLSFAALPAAKAWRAYHPLAPPAATSVKPVAQLPETAAWEELKSSVGSLARKLEVFQLALPPLEQQSRELADIVRRDIQTSLKTLVERVSTHERVVASGTYLLIRALRARDAMREILIPNDKIAISLGKRLAEAKATDYPDPASWLSDYQHWNAATRAIDRLMMEWTRSPSYEPVSLFDLEGRHFQNSPMPPENIRADDTIIPFKTVWYVQSSYANQRDGAFSFFNERITYPG